MLKISIKIETTSHYMSCSQTKFSLVLNEGTYHKHFVPIQTSISPTKICVSTVGIKLIKCAHLTRLKIGSKR